MSPYEEYKARIKVNDETTQQKSSSGCTSCRKKIAQDTYNMVAGGSQYMPTNEPLPGYFKTVEELCYPKQSNIPAQQLDNAIDRLYGRKMPDYTPINTVDNLYGNSYKNTFSNLLQTEPCGKAGDKFLFDNTIKKELFFGTELSNDCNLNLMYVPYIKKETFEHYLKIDLRDCCEKLIKTIFCEDVIQKYNKLEVWKGILETQYSNFTSCAEKLIDDAINSLDLSREIDGGNRNRELLMFKKKQFLYGINLAKERFIRNDDLIKQFTNFYGENFQSCLCGGFLPTYCCYPYYEDGVTKRPECWCGEKPKNLCEDCTEQITLPLPFEIGIFGKDGRNCWAKLTESGNSFRIYYWVYSLSNKLIDSGNEYIMKLPPIEPFNYERRLLPINIPKDAYCNIKIIIEFDCGWCCTVEIDNNEIRTNRKRIVTINIDNFSFSEWELKSDDEKKAFLNFNKKVNFDFLSTDFNEKDPNCYCQNC
ncbi:hypothetical protein D9V86_09230 [Bacteroidetes/Chlorobi group bacterium ChocPot_Mid]|nr:MAG: hypothetical protein D9V86_09230 [Bacteroidetes/Chlorobi group bacterium ChocPot_Mid]